MIEYALEHIDADQEDTVAMEIDELVLFMISNDDGYALAVVDPDAGVQSKIDIPEHRVSEVGALTHAASLHMAYNQEADASLSTVAQSFNLAE